MEDKEVVRHVYDLELKAFFRHYQGEIPKVQLQYADKPPDYFVGLIKFGIDDYCNSNDINFENEPQIIITPDQGGAYEFYLSLSLIFYPKFKIRQYLNYHEQLFSNKMKLKYSFVDLVEFRIADITYYSSPFDNSGRLDRIMEWVESKRSTGQPSNELKTKEKFLLSPIPVESLTWLLDSSLKKTLSEKLFFKNYTDRKIAFKDIFDFKKPIVWQDSLESWVYFMSELVNKYKCVTTSKGKKAYFEVGDQFFFFSKEKGKKRVRSTVLNNVLRRSREKHQKTRDDIDIVLGSIFKKDIPSQ